MRFEGGEEYWLSLLVKIVDLSMEGGLDECCKEWSHPVSEQEHYLRLGGNC